MAGGDEHKAPAGSPWEPVILIIGAFALGIAFIWLRGGLPALKSAGDHVLVPPPQLAPTPTN